MQVAKSLPRKCNELQTARRLPQQNICKSLNLRSLAGNGRQMALVVGLH